jgi:mannitol/fructose-specific phosphotransferase system IIA component (Ntr-type)
MELAIVSKKHSKLLQKLIAAPHPQGPKVQKDHVVFAVLKDHAH